VKSGWIEARAWAETQAQTWFLADDPPLVVGGVEIGWPLQVDAFEAFLRIAIRVGDITADHQGFSMTRTAKQRGLDRALRAHAMRLMGRAMPPRRRPGGTLFVSELPTPSMLEPSVRVAQAMPPDRTAVAAADPRVLRHWRGRGFVASPLLLPWRQERRLLARTRRTAGATFSAFLARHPTFDFNGIDVTEPAIRALRPLILNSAPWLAVELQALRRIVAACQPGTIVVATDQHRIGRLTVLAARGSGATVAVLQHGLPQTPIGFLPLVADEICVWSDGVRDWFTARGVDEAKVRVLGNPRLDDLVGLDRERSREQIDAERRITAARRLLVVLSPLGIDANLAVLEVAIDACRLDPGLTCIVKLHPGAGDAGPMLRRISGAGLGARMVVGRRESLVPLLLWADVTFLFRSTVALESLAAGTPVVVADYGPPSIADDELVDLRLPRARSGEELAGHVGGLTDASTRAAFFGERREAMGRMTGPVDGGAAHRIAASLASPGA
jgi:hypothetical protein